MPQSFTLTDDQLARFRDDGLLRLPGLIDQTAVDDARRAVLEPLAELGLWRDARWRLDERQRPVWPATGLKPARDIGHRHPEIEALVRGPRVRALVDTVLGRRDFDRRVYPRPQVLASLPNAGRWMLPNGWHTDLPRLAGGERPGVQLFTFLEPVRPRGGGTLVVAGSHRLLNDGRNLKVKEITTALRETPFFANLFRQRGRDEDQALPAGEVDGVPLRVMELAGAPGDVWLMDLRVLHAASPNAADRPRLMVTHRFVRVDLMPAIAAAFGWAEGADTNGSET